MPPTALPIPSSPPQAAPRGRLEAADGKRVRARTFGGEKKLGQLLRTGAVVSGGMFVLSVALEALPENQKLNIAIDMLRKGGLIFLVVTPLARLSLAATLLSLKGEWKYALYGAGVLLLLAFAIGAGFGA